MYKYSLTFIFALMLQSTSYAEVDESKLPNHKITAQRLYLTAAEAYQLKKSQPDNVLFVDVRTRAELEFVGVPDVVDVNIPYAFNAPEEWDAGKNRFKKSLNRNFFQALDKSLSKAGLDKSSKIIFMCRAGRRSALAANLIEKFNYNNVYTVVDGFEGDKQENGADVGKRTLNGWKNSGLPWSYNLDKEKMYFE